MVSRHNHSLTLTEIEYLCLEEDIANQNIDISIDDSDADPDYAIDQQVEEEDKELKVEDLSVFLPPPHTHLSLIAESLHVCTLCFPSNTSDCLYAPSTRKKRKEPRSFSCGRQQSSFLLICDDDDESDDHDFTSVPQ